MFRIGVIGAGGKIGQHVIQVLMKETECIIKGGYKSTVPALDSGRVEWFYLDVMDKELLMRFCRDCNIVINCAGPMHEIQDRIAIAANYAGAIYLDSYGTIGLGEKAEEIKQACIFGAGVYPGLTGIVLINAISKFEQVEKCVGISGSYEKINRGAAIDLLYSNALGFGIVGGNIKEGKVNIDKNNEKKYIDIASGFSRKRIYPYLPSEILSIVHEWNLPQLEWYNIEANEKYTNILSFAYKKIINGQSIEDDIEALLSMDIHEKDSWNVLLMDVEGIKNAERNKYSIEISNQSAYELTGIVLSETAVQILGKNIEKGNHWACNVVDTDDIIYRIKKYNNIHVSERFSKADETVDDLETGLI